MLQLELNTDSPEFIATTQKGVVARVLFLNTPDNLSYGHLDGAASFFVAEDVWCTVFSEDGDIVAVLTRDSDTPLDLTLSIQKDEGIRLSVQGGTLKNDESNNEIYNFRLSDQEVRMVIGDGLELHPARSFQSFSLSVPEFSALTLGDPYLVGAGERWPEWAIGVYDYMDVTGTLRRPRPMRYGVPVISTVATDGDWTTIAKTDYQGTSIDNLELGEQSDINQVRTGKAAPTRRMYFLAVCDNDIIDQIPVLQIYLPSGIDTVQYVPAEVTLANYKSNARQWWGYYDFQQEDGLQYVDGYCYLSIYIPMTVIRPLPLRLRYKTTGYSSGILYYDDPTGIEESVSSADATILALQEPSHTDLSVKVGIKDAGPKYQVLSI